MTASEITTLWRTFSSAPHRVMFFGGVLQTIAVMVWWLFELSSRQGLPAFTAEWSISPRAVHGYLMIYGIFPYFMFGFLMTTFPRWMRGKEVRTGHYVFSFLTLILGGLVFYIGLVINTGFLVAGLALTLTGWGIALSVLLNVLFDTTPCDKRHAWIIWIGLVMGWIGLASFMFWILTDNPAWLHFSIQDGIWFFLLPIFATVGHRMIPFFTGSALPHLQISSPHWPWWLMLVSSLGHGLLQLADEPDLLWLSDAPLALAAFYLAYTWRSLHTLHNPLVAILHIGIAWLGIAMAMFSLQSLLSLLSPGTIIWGLAPLHALTIGCFATLMIGMATRVTLGHSGLPMKADTPIKLMFLGIQLVAVLRILAELVAGPAMHWLYIYAGLVWLICFTPWVFRVLPVYLLKRADGRPG